MITLEFFGLLIISVALYWAIPKQVIRNLLLTLISLLFIYLMDKWSLVLVIVLSVTSFIFGMLIKRKPSKTWLHTIGVIFILGVLVAFKYLGFLNSVFMSLADFAHFLPRFEIRKLLLPLGISYIVFKHISYLTDIKWGLVKPGRFVDFVLYSSLFTIFVAGPIERYERFKPQIEQSRISFSWNNIDKGFIRIVFGLFKKLVLADWIGFFISPVWTSPNQYNTWIRLLALIGYSLQIYFDFAGYSDIAIGSSRLFGIKIMENFNNPYLSPSISQFWRRWHISLSDWIRDYLFFPLSKVSSKSLWQFLFVPVISMAICGLWHGPAWHYVLWGIWHGIALSLFQLWNQFKRKNKRIAKVTKSMLYQYAGTVLTFTYVSIGWLLFR
ncbi:MAG: hypothetical protein CVU49_00200 [Candidatus Cloacimonetes bacterium HGW-Cloacimonetes-2]|nr:MAG: hypothetical protein CVU49_00200 [Candidatus Cloacimonetes bacterium HGW-Cloacimonetes-2]